MKKTYYILLTFLLFTNLLAQESLYLIDTLVGKGSGLDERLYFAKGLGDINGDGFSEFIVDSGDSTRIYFGNPEFKLKADYSFTGRILFFPLSDINNDGYDDFILGKKLYYGAALFDTLNAIPFNFPHYYRQSISRQVGDIGDVNGDGYKDFVISSPYNFGNGFSFVWLYLGGDTVKTEPFVTFYSSPFEEGNSEGSFGTSVSGIGDVNNDGYDDILISDPRYRDSVGAESVGRVFLYYGGEEMDSEADSVLTKGDEIYFGKIIKNVGDINCDGINEFIISSHYNLTLYSKLDTILTIYTNMDSIYHIASVNSGGYGDVNDDGTHDLIFGYEFAEKQYGIICIYGKKEIDFVPDLYAYEEQKYSSYGKYKDFIGDYNGDGYDDIYVVAPTYRINGDEIGKLYLYSYKNYVGIEEKETSILKEFKLYQNYPNPFNPTTTIKYSISSSKTPLLGGAGGRLVTLKVYDILGRKVATLVNKEQSTGNYEVTFNAKNLPSGLYYYQLNAGDYSETKKMILIR